jgi:hypothetical protein
MYMCELMVLVLMVALEQSADEDGALVRLSGCWPPVAAPTLEVTTPSTRALVPSTFHHHPPHVPDVRHAHRPQGCLLGVRHVRQDALEIGGECVLGRRQFVGHRAEPFPERLGRMLGVAPSRTACDAAKSRE